MSTHNKVFLEKEESTSRTPLLSAGISYIEIANIDYNYTLFKTDYNYRIYRYLAT